MCYRRKWLSLFFLCSLALGFLFFLLNLLGSELLSSKIEELGEGLHYSDESIDSPGAAGGLARKGRVYLPPEGNAMFPIVVWWTPFTGHRRIERQCGEGTCIFTHSRTELNNTRTKAFMFYGSDIDWKDLPLPRQYDHFWALLHEESPKNNWILASPDGISLFNLTATCSRHSSYPLSTQYLHKVEWLERAAQVTTQDKNSNDLGLVIYLQSDCNPPSDRDSYVEELMKYVAVDSYGRCLHNKDLPEQLLDTLTFNSKEVRDIVAKYKFSLAFENAICHDYITEKFWRPLYAGSVPIVMGSPSIQDWAPTNHSVIIAADFGSPKELAEYLHYLDSNDHEYEKYLEFKKTGVTNPLLLTHFGERGWVVDYIEQGIDFIEGFECFVCNAIHRYMKVKSVGQEPSLMVANHDHYNCPMPKPSLGLDHLAKLQEHMNSELQYWRYVSRCSEKKGRVLHEKIAQGGSQEKINEELGKACAGI